MTPSTSGRSDLVDRLDALGPGLFSVVVAEAVVGYLRQEGHSFVALLGERFDEAVEVHRGPSAQHAAEAIVIAGAAHRTASA